MTENEAREFLKSHFYATQKIKALEDERRQLRIDAQGGSVSYESNYPSTKKNGVESNLVRLAAREQELDDEIAQLKCKRNRVRDVIARLNDDDLESVLINRYITYHTIEETAEIMNYAPRTVRKKQKQAYEKLCLIMP